MRPPLTSRCSLDDYILKTPNYYPDGLRATVDAFMMKFPDRSSVDFQCAIEVCSKFDQNCTAITVSYALCLLKLYLPFTVFDF
ncbi:hypothetical protein COOONC_24899 [Cooperia oncophora]